MDLGQLNEVLEIIAPRFHAVPGMKSIINEAEQIYIRLTNQQAALLDYLREQKTAVIHGLAGTGKTVLAKEKARMLAEEGEHVLFLCYNSFLKDYLRKHFSQPGIVFHNVHSLAGEMLRDEAIGVDELLSELEEYLIEVFELEDWSYKHIVIDEGQDLNEKLINRLNEMVKGKGGNFYVFYDRNQYVMRNEMPSWVEKAECRLILHRNCRNTVEIHNTACSMIPLEGNNSNSSVHGETPNAVFYMSRLDLLQAASKFVNTAINAGIEPSEIVFLTVETENKSWFSDINSVNDIPIKSDFSTDGILFTTVRKFKGLEAKAVMIIDVSIRALTHPEKQRLAYVGCSRAKHLLSIAIYDDTNSAELGDCLRRINSSRNVPKNKKGLGRLLNVKIDH